MKNIAQYTHIKARHGRSAGKWVIQHVNHNTQGGEYVVKLKDGKNSWEFDTEQMAALFALNITRQNIEKALDRISEEEMAWQDI